jgi:antitoxin component of MazEF toxin-antitoxin module
VKEKEYPKWVVTIPSKKIGDLGWEEGEELDATIEAEKLILTRKKVKP